MQKFTASDSWMYFFFFFRMCPAVHGYTPAGKSLLFQGKKIPGFNQEKEQSPRSRGGSQQFPAALRPLMHQNSELVCFFLPCNYSKNIPQDPNDVL